MRALPSIALLATALAAASCGDNQTVPVAHQPYTGAPPAALSCVPNLDGQIDANELQAAIGVPESMLVSPAGATRPIDVVGAVDAEGHRIWDFSFDDGSDQLAQLEAGPLAGAWFAGSFPNGQFTAPIDAARTLLGVYVHDDTALWLLGIASAVQHPAEGETLLVYDAPVALYRFPILPGAHWVSSGTIRNGLIRDLPY